MKLNANDLTLSYSVKIAALSSSGKGEYSSPVNLSLPVGLPISVQPNLAEVENTAWLILLLGSLTFMLLLLSSVMFYYRRKREMEKSTGGYLPAAIPDMDYHQQRKNSGNAPVWHDRQWNNSDCEIDSTSSNKKLLQSNSSDKYNIDFKHALPGNVENVQQIAYLKAGGCSEDKINHQLFESPYATTELAYNPHGRCIKVNIFLEQ